MKRIRIAGCLVVVALRWAAGAVCADEDHAGHQGMQHGSAPMRGEAVAGAWSALLQTPDAIAAALDAGMLGEIHQQSGALVPRRRTLLEPSTNLAAEPRSRAVGALKQLPGVADALRDAGDARRPTKPVAS